VRATPFTGRILVFTGSVEGPEPRLGPDWFQPRPFYGLDVRELRPGQTVVLDERALGYPTPEYVHLPLVYAPDGTKLGKRDGALPLPALDDARVRETLALALRHLGLEVAPDEPRRMLEDATILFR